MNKILIMQNMIRYSTRMLPARLTPRLSWFSLSTAFQHLLLDKLELESAFWNVFSLLGRQVRSPGPHVSHITSDNDRGYHDLSSGSTNRHHRFRAHLHFIWTPSVFISVRMMNLRIHPAVFSFIVYARAHLLSIVWCKSVW